MINGAAFAAVVSSLVDDVFMPVAGLILAQIDFSKLFVVLSNPNNVPVPSLAAAKAAGVAPALPVLRWRNKALAPWRVRLPSGGSTNTTSAP